MARFSLAQLAAIIGGFALAFAALCTGAKEWFQAIYALTLIGLTIALLGALIGTPSRGAWWGFALFGWGYFVLTFIPAVRSSVGVFLADTGVLDRVADQCHKAPSAPPSAQSFARFLPGFRSDFFEYQPFNLIDPSNPTNHAYYQARRAHMERVHYSQGVVYLLACWVAGVAGSIVGRILGRRAEANPR